MQISSDLGGIPQKAIDGSTSSFFNVDTCTLTRPERVPWWYVNLLEPYMVQLVRLDFGKRNHRPDLGINPICNRFTGQLEEGKPLFLPCNPPMPGAFVSVHLEGSNLSQLSICEAFVYTDQALPIERCPQFRDQPPGSTATYNGKCYIFYNRQQLNFKDALDFCRNRRGTLLDESNPALQGFISWELWRRHRSESNSQYWMGAVRDPQDRNNWKWLDGKDVTVSFWNLPGGNDNCARFDGSKGWLWSDTNCNSKMNFICQHQPKSCGKPEQPPNSTMKAENFNVGSHVYYSCDGGTVQVGPEVRVCLSTGFYNEFPPVCRQITCGLPAEIPNGHYQLINGTVGYMSRVKYSCDEGYELVGRAHLICDEDERWSGPPPRCERVRCEALIEIPNGRYVVSNQLRVAGTVVEFSCMSSNYTLTGPSKIVCLEKNDPAEEEVVVPEVVVPVPTGTTRTSAPPTRPSATTPHHSPAHVPHVIVASHPQDNEIPDSVNVRSDHAPNVNVAHSVDEERRESGARLNLDAYGALGVFGGFVFLAAVITTIVILIRRNRSTKHYRHRASPDCNTVASFDSSGSESRGGLNRYYRQAWENLHHESVTAGNKSKSSNHSPLRRKETLDEPVGGGYRNVGGTERDGSELVVNDTAAMYPPKPSAVAAAEKKRHHHHHHHHGTGATPKESGDWRQQARKSRY
ncbi:hypothetical protein L9F63_022192 [Diploptera punctata]|uniref:Sushi, von Willebrand factor type A, EGF and pentraxin domain-containing protein 1 n=1 Tax=Diploptera punctata TaxID=6984 RepID=A0AAD8EBA3_DIPPU|nr:hypothetical protein L9F63_022192 [Diploptera punctata]